MIELNIVIYYTAYYTLYLPAFVGKICGFLDMTSDPGSINF